MVSKYFKYIAFFLISFYFGSIFVLHFIHNDGVQFSVLGYNLFHHGGYNDSYGVVPGWIQSPAWPVVLGFFTYFFPLIYAGQISTFIISIFLLILFFRFVRREYNLTMALLSTLILVFNPAFLAMMRSGLSEPLYVLLLLLIFMRMHQLFVYKKYLIFEEVVIYAVLGLALQYTRSEGILYVIFIVGLILILNRKQKPKTSDRKTSFLLNYNSAIVAALLFLTIISLGLYPYGQWIKKKSGTFNPLPKITFNTRLMKLSMFLGKALNIRPENKEFLEELGWFALDSTTNDLYSAHLLNNQYYQNVKKRFNASDKPVRLRTLLVVIKKNLINTFRVLVRSSPFPLFFLILIMIGGYYFFKDKPRDILFILLWIIPSFYFILSHVEDRFFYVMLPYVSLIAAYGLYSFGHQLNKPILVGNTFLILLLLNASLYYFDFFKSLQNKQVYYHIAQTLKIKIPHNNNKICAKNFAVTFYSGHGFAKMPICSPENLYGYLKHKKVRYLLLGKEVFTLRREFLPIFNAKKSYLEFKRELLFKDDDTMFKLFKIE